VSELTARLAIYGAIDRAVVDGRLPVDDVAVHLPPYRPRSAAIAGAAGWYEHMASIVGVGPDGSSLELVDAGAAVASLAETSIEHPIDAEHRLRVLFLAGRLLSDELDTSPDSDFVRVMQSVAQFGRDPDEVGDWDAVARDLTSMVVGDLDEQSDDDGGSAGGAVGGGGAGYLDLAATAGQRNLVSTTTASLAATVCDEGTAWYQVPGTADADVAAVVTSRVTVVAAECSVDDLRKRFHPGRWPACLPTFWGGMVPLAPSSRMPSPKDDPEASLFVYREQVGDQTNGSQWFSPVLEFWYEQLFAGPPPRTQPEGFAIHYGMARELPKGQAQDPNILVDDGEMAIRRSATANGSMAVSAFTYKKLAMRPPLPAAGLAIFACASGWAGHAKALVTGCLLNP
jgi:hypothetical protein